MSYREHVTINAVNERGSIENGDRTANDVVEISAAEVSSAAHVTASNRRYKLFLKILQRINMVFLVTFICYFAWTISANYGYKNSGIQKINANGSSFVNSSSLQVEETSNVSGSRHIPFHSSSSSDDNHTDPPYHTNIVLPAHRKQTKKRRKKGRNRKRNRRLRNKHKTYGSLEEYLNLTIEPRKNRNIKGTPCTDCKIRKRKGRNKFGYSSRISPSTLRRILEKVADETLSGARSGEGTVSGLLDDKSYHSNSVHDENLGKDSGWSYNQHWVNIAAGDTISADDSFFKNDQYKKQKSYPWSSWSRCSVTCGAGQRERMRKCGTACKEVESMVCVNPPCEDTTSDESRTTITEFYKWESEGFVPPLHVPEQEFLDPSVDVCSNWVKCNKQYAKDFIDNSSLPSCPCFYPLIRVKSKDIWDTKLNKSIVWNDSSSHHEFVYKPEAHSCIRSQLMPGAVTLAVQQCCYDDTGALVTRGKAAGTPNLISPSISKELHYKLDLLPWIICKGDWTRYNQVLPPDNGLVCRSNPDDNTITRQKQEVNNY